MKITSIALPSLLVVMGAAHAAPVKGAIKIAPPEEVEDFAFGFETHAPWAKAWGARSRHSVPGPSKAADHRKNRPDVLLPEISEWNPSWQAFLGTPPEWANNPNTPPGLVRAAPASVTSQVVPDGGTTWALLGFSAFGLLTARGILRKQV